MRKKLIIGLSIMLILVLLTGCTNKKVSKTTDAIKFKEEYESLNDQINEGNQKKYPKVSIDKSNPIQYATIDDVLEVLDNKTGVIYFGFPNCPWCRNAVPVLLNAATSTGLDRIYYLNVLDIRDTKEIDNNGKVVTTNKGKKGYSKLLEKMDSILPEYTLEDEDENEVSANEKRIYVPLVVFVKKGKIVAYHEDTVESQKDPYKLLDDKQTEELFNIYVDGILKMQDSACDDNC